MSNIGDFQNGAYQEAVKGVTTLYAFDFASIECKASAALPDWVPRHGFFLLSLQRDVDETLSALAALGFTDGVRRITVAAPGRKTVPMAVISAPDGVLVELIGPAQ